MAAIAGASAINGPFPIGRLQPISQSSVLPMREWLLTRLGLTG